MTILNFEIAAMPSSQTGLNAFARPLCHGMSVVCLSLFLSACGGSSGSSGDAEATTEASVSQVPETGELILTLTDAEGDFLAYGVDVESLQLIKANGAVVETVPLNTRIDFTEYTDLTEIFNIITVLAGTYTQASMVVDYTNAEIIIQDEDGESLLATAVDAEGEALNSLTMSISWDSEKPLVIKRGVPAALTLDFDLHSSNTITSYDPATVEVDAVILADAQLNHDRDHRARGLLQSVSLEDSSFALKIRPFRHFEGAFGEITVNSADETSFEIDGETLTGSEGLAALAEQEESTPLIVFGSVGEGRIYSAERVLAGSSIPWVGRDVVRGVVRSRDSNSLTIRGGYHEAGNGSITFQDDIVVSLADTTRIGRQGMSNEGLSISDISVGQRIFAFGTVSSESSNDFVLDASDGFVRMNMNLIKGEVVSVSPLILDLAWINGRRLELFDFTGTGLGAETDADADNYEVATQSLGLSTLDIGDLVKVRGFPTAFGAAPEDYTAQTIIEINTGQRGADLKMGWNEDNAGNPFLDINSDQLIVDTTEARHKVKMAGIPRGKVEDQASYVIRPTTQADKGLYALKVRGEPAIQIFSVFADFVDALNARLNEGSVVRGLNAIGRYDQTTATMVSVEVNVIVH